MNPSLRMILVLGLIAAVAAGLLAGINEWTSPIIERNTEERLLRTLAQVIDADDFVEQEDIDPDYNLWHALKRGNLVGYVVQLTGQGYSSAGIEILVGLNTEAIVQGVHIFGHSETPGLGDKIERPAWLKQFAGKGIESPFATGPDGDVDSITGSTSSAMAVINTVRRAVQTVGRYVGLIEDIDVDFASIPDGTYTGSGRGFIGDITVEVTFQGGQLTEVKVLSHSETPSYAANAVNNIPKAMVDAQEIDVDVVSGATGTSQGIIAAVKNALVEFIGGEPEEPIDITTLANGRYIGSAQSFGRDGELVVEVTIADGKIVEIEVLEHHDTPDYANPAFPVLRDRIIDSQELEVDTVSGATATSIGYMDAVQNALRNEPEIDISELPDGIYVGEAEGFGRDGMIKVQVTVAGGSITNIEVLSHNDTPDIANPAFNSMIGKIVDAQDLEVDAVTDATISSEGIINAVAAALRSQPLLDVSKISDGVYNGAGEGFMGDIAVKVTVAGGKITAIEVVSHGETPDFFVNAVKLLDTMKDEQSIYVDAIAGATYSSHGLLEAVEAALRGAQ